MTTESVVLLIVGVIEVASLTLLGAVYLGLWWTVSQLSDQTAIRSKLSEVTAHVENLELQVQSVRKKQARSSPARPRADREEEPDVNPLLAGLSEEDAALFQ